MYWVYYDSRSMTTYYTESYSMSASNFAQEVSILIGKTISASDVQDVKRQSDLDRQLNPTHI